MAKISNVAYWKKRREDAQKYIAKNLADDAKMQTHIQKRYNVATEEIQREIDRQYVNFAATQKLSMAAAMKAVSAEDVQAFANTAARMVADLDFSEEANARLKLYNATMRINRLEYLKARVGLAMTVATEANAKDVRRAVSQSYLDEKQRQSGILGEFAADTNLNKTIVNLTKQYNIEGFSDMVWKNQDLLKSKLDNQLTRAMIQGLSPRKIARELRPLVRDTMKSATYATERIARTETARAQTQAQVDCFKENDVDRVEVVAEPSACKICHPLDGKVTKLNNAPVIPLHPNCRCALAPLPDWEGMNKGINEYLEERDNNNDVGFSIPDVKDYGLNRDAAIKALSSEFDIKIVETSRTKLSDIALNQAYGVLKSFEDIYNQLPQKIPQIRAMPKSEARDAIAWYSHRVSDGAPIEFAMNAAMFKDARTLQSVVDRCTETKWFSQNSSSNHVMVHEFAHHIDAQLSQMTGRDFGNDVISDMMEEHGDKYKPNYVASETGRYAYEYFRKTRSVSEAFAELLSEAYGGTPRQIALDFKKKLEIRMTEVLKK